MLLRRCFASATAQARPNPMIAPIQQNTSRLPNGLTISSVDLQGPVSQLVFAFRSGSRFQQFDEGGLAHVLRNSIGTDSDHYLGLKLLWQTAATGSSLQSRVSKDLLCVHMSVSRTQAPVALSILGEIVQPAIKPWDILSVVRELEVDLKHQSATEKLIENLHRAAFRNGSLANPLLSASFEIGNDENIGFRKLQQYVLSRWKTAECALVGVNIDHSLLLEYAAEQSPIAEGRGHEANPSPFLGGDVRQAGPGQLAHVAVAGQGAKLSDEKAVAVQTVLCALIGQTGHYTGYNSIAQPGMVHKAVFKASNHSAFQLFPLNISHADNGLAGFHLVAEGSKINPYVKAAVQALRELANTSVNQDLLQISKQTAEMEALLRSESGEVLALDQAVQVLARGTAQTQEDFVKLVQAVSAEDVKKAASQLCAKLAMSAYGQIHQVPYADEL